MPRWVLVCENCGSSDRLSTRGNLTYDESSGVWEIGDSDDDVYCGHCDCHVCTEEVQAFDPPLYIFQFVDPEWKEPDDDDLDDEEADSDVRWIAAQNETSAELLALLRGWRPAGGRVNREEYRTERAAREAGADEVVTE